MTRDELYDHLAQVYLGKRKKVDDKDNKKTLNVWLLINGLITVIIFASAFYGLTAFFTRNSSLLSSNVIYSLHRGTVTLDYQFAEGYPPVKSFQLDVPPIEMAPYHQFEFAIRAREEGNPGIIKVIIQTARNEEASYYIQGVNMKWQTFTIPFEEFPKITDWSQITSISFVLESWNVENKKGLVLIENIGLSS